jgi:hypothetical protein
MGRGFALRAEILRRTHESGSEELLPHAVHGDSRGQRIVPRDQPSRQCETIASVRIERRKHGRRVRLHHVTRVLVVAADVHAGRRNR